MSLSPTYGVDRPVGILHPSWCRISSIKSMESKPHIQRFLARHCRAETNGIWSPSYSSLHPLENKRKNPLKSFKIKFTSPQPPFHPLKTSSNQQNFQTSDVLSTQNPPAARVLCSSCHVLQIGSADMSYMGSPENLDALHPWKRTIIFRFYLNLQGGKCPGNTPSSRTMLKFWYDRFLIRAV